MGTRMFRVLGDNPTATTNAVARVQRRIKACVFFSIGTALVVIDVDGFLRIKNAKLTQELDRSFVESFGVLDPNHYFNHETHLAFLRDNGQEVFVEYYTTKSGETMSLLVVSAEDGASCSLLSDPTRFMEILDPERFTDEALASKGIPHLPGMDGSDGG